MTAGLDHVALKVSDLEWHVEFFKQVFGMTVKKMAGEKPERKVWFNEGIQLNEIASEDYEKGQMDHLGIITNEYDKTAEKIRKWNAAGLPQGDNWFRIPSGICIELMKE